jgi:hypothetical protein
MPIRMTPSLRLEINFPRFREAHPSACRRRTTVVFHHSVGWPVSSRAFPDVRDH